MKFDQIKLNKDIDAVCKDWDISGAFLIAKDGITVHENTYGYADRENNIYTSSDGRYVFNTESKFFVNLSMLMLIDQGKIKLNDTLDKFIPEYKHGSQITVKHLIKNNSGILDFYYGQIMIALNNDEKHKAMPEFDRVRAEVKAFNQSRNFEKVMKLIGDEALEYAPGTSDRPGSESNYVFLAEIIRRVTKQSVFDFLNQSVFKPLEMHQIKEGSETQTVSYSVIRENVLIRLPLDYHVDGLMTATADDMKKLLLALGSAKILSKKMWDKALKLDADGDGLGFENANGFACCDAQFMGFGFFAYFNHSTGVAFASLVNEEQQFRNIANVWHYFRRDSRERIEAAFTYPVDTKMVPLNTKNFWHVLNLTVADDQQQFVLECKSSIAMALMFKTKKAFVEMEGNRAVGLLVLDIDKKKGYYHIDIILIDKRFQGRGYGKIMLKWAVEYLTTAGAKELAIGVNRFNYAAQKIYMDAGFTAKRIYEEGMELHMTLGDGGSVS